MFRSGEKINVQLHLVPRTFPSGLDGDILGALLSRCLRHDPLLPCDLGGERDRPGVSTTISDKSPSGQHAGYKRGSHRTRAENGRPLPTDFYKRAYESPPLRKSIVTASGKKRMLFLWK